MPTDERRWTDADRDLVARSVHDHACTGDDCSWSEEPRACDLSEFAGFGEAVLDALTADGWRKTARPGCICPPAGVMVRDDCEAHPPLAPMPQGGDTDAR